VWKAKTAEKEAAEKRILAKDRRGHRPSEKVDARREKRPKRFVKEGKISVAGSPKKKESPGEIALREPDERNCQEMRAVPHEKTEKTPPQRRKKKGKKKGV